MKVYIVQHGRYSDRYVAAIYASRTHAEAHAAMDGDADVEEVTVETQPPRKVLRHTGYVYLAADGSEINRGGHAWEEIQGRAPKLHAETHPGRTYYNQPATLVQGEGGNHARLWKALDDRVAKVRAESLEPTP